jgi:hypothetical protein
MVSIYAVHYNKVELLNLQYESIKKFCTDSFRYFVVNNGIDANTSSEISRISKELNLEEITIRNNNKIKMTAMHHKEALQYCYDNYISSDDADVRVVMDCDIIPFDIFSFKSFIGDADIAGIQLGVEPSLYIASFISLYSKNIIFDRFNLGSDIESDSGVPTGALVKKYKTKWLNHTAPMREEEGLYVFKNAKASALKYDQSFGIQFIESSLLHYYRGTGWDNGDIDYLQRKAQFIESFLESPDVYDINLDDNIQYTSAHMDQWLFKDKYKLYKIIQ